MQLVADANVLLSTVIGGRAALALRHDDVEHVLTPVTAYDEVLRYLPPSPRRNGLDWTRSSWPSPLFPSPMEHSAYEVKLPTARRRIGKRDPDDVNVLALAITLGLAVWSNANDLENPASSGTRRPSS